MQQNRAHPHPWPIPVQPVHHRVSLPLSMQFLPSLLNSTRCTRRRNRIFPTGIPSVSPRPTALYPLCAFPKLAPAQTGPQEGWVVQWGLLSCLLTSFFSIGNKNPPCSRGIFKVLLWEANTQLQDCARTSLALEHCWGIPPDFPPSFFPQCFPVDPKPGSGNISMANATTSPSTE